jgi:hypothetical protein
MVRGLAEVEGDDVRHLLPAIAIVLAAPVSGQTEEAFTPAQRATGEALVNYAARYFAITLRDPGSAIFRNVVIRRRGEKVSVCGEVNARNGFGGYTGFDTFMIFADRTIHVGHVAGFEVAYLCGNNNPIIDTRDYSPEMTTAFRAVAGS